MKFLAIFAIFLLFVNLSHQLPELLNCASDYVPPSSVANSCGVFTCDGSGDIRGVGCPSYRCAPGKELGYTEQDDSKSYPACCRQPICAE